MTASELERLLKKNGCKLLKQNKKHAVWINPANGKVQRLPRHPSKEVKTGTVTAILKNLGID